MHTAMSATFGGKQRICFSIYFWKFSICIIQLAVGRISSSP
jgi:hypothetical protein